MSSVSRFSFCVLLAAGLILCVPGKALCAAGTTATETAEPTSDSEPLPLSGRVLGDAGEPLEGASVRIRLSRTEDDRGGAADEPLVIGSAKDGSFSSGELSGLRFDVRVHATGYACWTGRDLEPSAPLTVQLEHGRPLAGRVLAETTGQGIAGATVRLDDSKKSDFNAAASETITDAEGGYSFAHAPVGTAWVQAVADGRAQRFVQGQVRATAGDSEAVLLDDIWLPEGGSLAGRVVDATGEPIAGAKVWMSAVDNLLMARQNRFPPSVVFSDAKGRFTFEGVTAGTRYSIGAKADGYASGSVAPIALEGGDVIEEITLTLRPGSALRLRIVDGDERPVTELTVYLDAENYQSYDRSARRYKLTSESPDFETDEQGWITLRRLSPGLFSVRVEPREWSGISREGVVLVEGETTDLGTLTVEGGSALSGQVVDSHGAPVAGADVLARWQVMYGSHERRATAGDDGSFTLSGLHEYQVTLEASATGFATRTMEEVASGSDPVTVKLNRNGGIRGTVRLAEGTVPESFTVRAIPRRDALEAADTAEIGPGVYEFSELAPGTYTVEVRAPGRAPGYVRNIKVQGSQVSAAAEVRLEAGLSFKGRIVRDDDGAAAAGARIRIDRGSGPSLWSEPSYAATISDQRGHFAFAGLEPGSYKLTVDHVQFAPLHQNIELDPDGPAVVIELRLTDGGEIRGSVIDADGLPVAGADVYIVFGIRGYDSRLTTTLADGSFHFPRLAPGTYTIWRLAAGARSTFNSRLKTVKVNAGKTTNVNFSN